MNWTAVGVSKWFACWKAASREPQCEVGGEEEEE